MTNLETAFKILEDHDAYCCHLLNYIDETGKSEDSVTSRELAEYVASEWPEEVEFYKTFKGE
jgi:hypothetical protein